MDVMETGVIRSDIPFASKGIHSQVSHNLDRWHD